MHRNDWSLTPCSLATECNAAITETAFTTHHIQMEVKRETILKTKLSVVTQLKTEMVYI